MKNIFLITAIILLLSSCGFRRDNPLDPEFSHTDAPPKVTNLHGDPIIGNIKLKWDRVNNSSGYHVYRSKVHNGAYELLNDIDDDGDIVLIKPEIPLDHGIPLEYESSTSNISAGWYYFKVSACIIIDPELSPLEGELSELFQIHTP